MLIIGLLAPVFVAWVWLRDLGRALNAHYGPDGYVENPMRQGPSRSETLGDTLLGEGRLADAESVYRQAMDLEESLVGYFGYKPVLRVKCKLAETLVREGRRREANPLYRQVSEALESNPNLQEPFLSDALERHARSPGKRGR
jgi:hypothetical protein